MDQVKLAASCKSLKASNQRGGTMLSLCQNRVNKESMVSLRSLESKADTEDWLVVLPAETAPSPI
jgi:hypothetical protein